jgi:hypothetical protein
MSREHSACEGFEKVHMTEKYWGLLPMILLKLDQSNPFDNNRENYGKAIISKL